MKRKYGMYYSTFLKIMRTGKNVTLEQLGWGICSVSMMSRIEEGRRLPEKMTRDRLMDRLGVANDGFEDYLQPDEYILWKARQDLLHAIENNELDRAGQMICQYERNDGGGNAIERQFYLAMKVQVMRRQGALDEETQAVLKCAIGLTMPECLMDQWKGYVLADQEWNLLLEYIRCGGNVGQIMENGHKASAYEALLEAIQESKMDIYSRAKIYPKAAYYLCLELMKKPKEDWDFDRLFRISGSAVETLRSAGRMYYLSELLEIEEQVITLLVEEFGILTGNIKGLVSRMKQVREWRKVLTEVYRDGDVSEKMENDCYLYWQTQNYCYGDVVRKRRKMLGMSVEELCAGICEKRTIWRLESNTANTHIEIIGELFERLGLSCEYARKRVVTDTYEAIALYDAATKAIINRDADALRKIWLQLRDILPMDLVINRQEVDFLENIYMCDTKQITEEECARRLQQVLEYTVPLECVKYMETGYLSCGEMAYLCNIAMVTNEKEKRIYLKLLERICEDLVKENGIRTHINTYELIMCNLASYLGDIGEYERSNEISDSVMRACLSIRRLNVLKNCIYNRWWNQNECEAEDTSVGQESEWELQKCIQLAGLCGDKLYEKFYSEKLNSLYAIKS